MKKHSKKLLSLFLAAALTVTFSMPVSAEEGTPLFDSSVAAELESVAAELESLEPGTDYVDKEGVFIADTREDAERIAAQYNGTLKSYNHRIAVVQFKESTVDALIAAAHCDSTDSTNSPNSPEALIEPNYIYHTMDVDNDISVSDSNIFSMGHLESTLTNDPYADSADPHYQYFHEKINTLKAHETTTGKGAKIAVIDSGCTPDHEDSAFDDEHALHIDSLSSGTDITDGHGIHCTGIIHEEKGNSLGGFGVAPDAEIYSVKAFETDRFPTYVLLEALSIAIEKNVNVISMSVGGPGYSSSSQQLINEAYDKGIMIVAAAGNENSSTKEYPAAYDHVLAVAATDKNENLADYSNYGDWVDIAAPGTAITSTYLYGDSDSIAGTSPQNTYGSISGTSMATPVVAGVAALCYAANPDLLDMGSCDAVEYVTEAILNTTDGREYSYSDHSVKGLVQADKAVEEIQKYATSKNYTLVDEAGNYGALLRGNIAQGKKVKLKIGDLKGNTNTKELKKALKNAKWTSSSSSVTVKNGVVKCDKKAVTDSEVTITAEIEGDTLQCKYTITKPLKAAGSYTTVSNKKGGYKLKIKSTIKFDSAVKCGTEVDLISPNSNLNSNACLFFDKKYTTEPVWYSADSAFKYSVTFSKKDISKGYITLVNNKKGRPVKAILNNPGKYTIKFKTIDGSNKTFTYKLEVA